jgi:group I intron endonuclease
MIYTIYKSVNRKTNQVYIGFDSKWPNRQKVHKSASKNGNSKFYNAIRKYGWDSFDWEIIYQSKDRDHTLNVMESYFIEQYNSFNTGYNLTLGGDGTFGHHVSEESKLKISLANKVPKPQTPEHSKKIGNSNRGKIRSPLTEDHKNKISISTKGVSKPMSEVHIKNLQCHKNNQVTIQCPHCSKSGQLTNMKRWHFDNCKSIPQSLIVGTE